MNKQRGTHEGMTDYDVVVIGAGAAGLSAGALLATEGKRVLVADRSPVLGGRAMAVPDEGFKVNVGGHLIEDPGSGLTKVFEHVGKELVHGATSAEMPVWDHEKQAWGSVRDCYSGSKAELKKVIKALIDTPYEELDRWDDRNLRQWLHQHTSDQGVIDLFEFITVLECMTENWWDHSASDNLFVRKMHFAERGTAAYSCWPGQGWDGMWADLADAIREHGGELRLGTQVERVIIENHEVKGIAVARQPRVLPNEFFEEEIIEAPCVISTLPVWHVLKVVPEEELPDWYTGQIRYLAQDKWRIAWLGLYLATEEPVHQYDPRELSTWVSTPRTSTSGFMFNQTAMDPTCSPAGTNLYVMGAVFPGEKGRDQRLTEQPLVRALCVLLPAAVFRALGVEPPLEGAGSGFHDFIPTEIGREEALRIVDAIPPAVVRHYAFCGTPEQVAAQLREYAAAGLRHLVMWNITAFGDPALARFSFGAMKELRTELAR